MFIESFCLFQINSETCWKGNNRLFLPPSSAKKKKHFMSYIEKGLEWGSSELVQPAKNYKHRILILSLLFSKCHHSFIWAQLLPSQTGRLRCGNQQKFLWCRNTGKRLCRCCSHWIPGREAWAWGAIAKSWKIDRVSDTQINAAVICKENHTASTQVLKVPQ